MWHGEFSVTRWLGLVCLIVVTGWVSGCGGGAPTSDNPAASSTGIRTGGGSIPDGEDVSGVVVSSTNTLPPLVRSAGADAYVPAEGAQVVLEGPDGAREVCVTGSDGRFAFRAPHSGRSLLRFDLNGNSNAADIQVKVRGGKRTEVVAGLVPEDSQAPAGSRDRIRIAADAPWVRPGEPVYVRAFLQRAATGCPEIVWLMETRTDASIFPTSDPNVLEVRAGSGTGWVEVQARLERAESNTVRLFVGPR